jgi:biotin carboxyl carrier protein
MRFTYQVDEQVHTVDLEKSGDVYRATVNGQTFEVKPISSEQGAFSFSIGDRPKQAYVAAEGTRRWVFFDGRSFVLNAAVAGTRPVSHDGAGARGERAVRAPMPGKVRAVQVEPGDEVEKGQTLLLLEAMKMEIRIQAPHAGRVERLTAKQGQTVERDQVLVEIE